MSFYVGLFIKAKPTIGVFDSRVKCFAMGAEAQAQKVTVVRTVPNKERAIRHIRQLPLCLPARDGSPVPPLFRQFFQLLRKARHNHGAATLHRVVHSRHPRGRVRVKIQMAAHAFGHVGVCAGERPEVPLDWIGLHRR